MIIFLGSGVPVSVILNIKLKHFFVVKIKLIEDETTPLYRRFFLD